MEEQRLHTEEKCTFNPTPAQHEEGQYHLPAEHLRVLFFGVLSSVFSFSKRSKYSNSFIYLFKWPLLASRICTNRQLQQNIFQVSSWSYQRLLTETICKTKSLGLKFWWRRLLRDTISNLCKYDYILKQSDKIDQMPAGESGIPSNSACW